MALRKRIGWRQKGTPNRVTRAIREHFAEAFELLQEDKTVNLVSRAKTNPTEFYRLASKLIPLQLETETQQATQSIIKIVPEPNYLPVIY